MEIYIKGKLRAAEKAFIERREGRKGAPFQQRPPWETPRKGSGEDAEET